MEMVYPEHSYYGEKIGELMRFTSYIPKEFLDKVFDFPVGFVPLDSWGSDPH